MAFPICCWFALRVLHVGLGCGRSGDGQLPWRGGAWNAAVSRGAFPWLAKQVAASPCGAVFTHGPDPGALLLCIPMAGFLQERGFGIRGGEESVNPALRGEVTAVSSEENALLCSWAGRGQPRQFRRDEKGSWEIRSSGPGLRGRQQPSPRCP